MTEGYETRAASGEAFLIEDFQTRPSRGERRGVSEICDKRRMVCFVLNFFICFYLFSRLFLPSAPLWLLRSEGLLFFFFMFSQDFLDASELPLGDVSRFRSGRDA